MPESSSGLTPGRALRQSGLRPRKRLGQNFLRDPSYLRRILAAADVGPDDEVVEIGAGTGVLTRELAQSAGELIAVELDDKLFQMLTDEFASQPNVELWHGNALDFDPCRHFAGPYKLLGNIPYYITGPILRHYLGTPCRPSVLVLMVQREVAERMVARAPGSNLLAVSVQAYAQPEIVARVPAGAFYPPPRVDSAIVRLTPHRQPRFGSRGEQFFQLVRAGFSTRRKQLANALANGLSIPSSESRALLVSADIDASRRAETLELDEWVRLTGIWLQLSASGEAE